MRSRDGRPPPIVRNIQPINRSWTEDFILFQTSAKQLAYLSTPGIFCLPRQNTCWDYFAFCGTWLVEVVMTCDKHIIQSYMLGLVCKPETPNLNLTPSTRSGGSFAGLSHPIQKLQAPPNCNRKHMLHKSVEFLSISECQDPCTNVKYPYWRLSGDGSALNQKLST